MKSVLAHPLYRDFYWAFLRTNLSMSHKQLSYLCYFLFQTGLILGLRLILNICIVCACLCMDGTVFVHLGQRRTEVPWAGALCQPGHCSSAWAVPEVPLCTATPVSNLLGHQHTLSWAAPKNHIPSLFSNACSRITPPLFFPGYCCDFILLAGVEMLSASWKLLETGRPFMEMLTQLYL